MTIELAVRKIRVNTTNARPTETETQVKFGMDEATLKALKEGMLSKVPLVKMEKKGSFNTCLSLLNQYT